MVRLKEKKKERTAQEEIISHPSRYILQTIQCFSEPTIRGQPEESKPPPSSLRKKKGTVSEREKKIPSMCLAPLEIQDTRSKLGSMRVLWTIKVEVQ